MTKQDLQAYVLIAIISTSAGVAAFLYQDNDLNTVKSVTKHIMNEQPVGSVIPNLALNDALQKKSSLYDYKTDYVLINFWATWCPPCRREIPILKKLNHDHDNLTVLGFSYDVDYAILEYQQKMKIDYPLFLSNPDTIKLNALFGNKSGGLPYSVLLDKAHKIIMVQSGEITENQIQRLLK